MGDDEISLEEPPGCKNLRRAFQTHNFRTQFFPDATDDQWNDWHWQSRNRIRTPEQLERILVLSESERNAVGQLSLPLGITPYYMSLLSREDATQPLRRTVIPTDQELIRSVGEADDPLGEDSHTPLPGLVHRYPDRVLLLALDTCATYCRYCTRSRVVGHHDITPSQQRLENALSYIREHRQIRDVLISGGDPLTMSDGRLDWLIGQVRSIPHVEFIRIGTKAPVVLPQRITKELCNTLRKYHPLWISIHFTHPEECTDEVYRACTMLADAGIPLGSQTVLLKGINDSPEVMKSLMHKLLRMRVRPYYLYQCDPITGSSHFRTPVSKGLEIIEALRGHTTGYAVPTYVIDAPGGGGKIPLQPNYCESAGDVVMLRNYENKCFQYHNS